MTELEKAARQALEALESYHGYMEPLTTVFGGPRVPAEQSTTGKVEKAITALRRALADHALDKMAENARELGLDYDQGWKDGYKHGAWASEQQPAEEPPVLAELNCVCGAVWEWRNRDWELMESPQPAAQWVGLTPADFDWLEQMLASKVSNDFVFADIVCAIEAKLKEKNHA